MKSERVAIAHSPDCPVNLRSWDDCNCGLFLGYGEPLAWVGGHKAGCPCHCSCDFGQRLLAELSGITRSEIAAIMVRDKATVDLT